MFLFRRSTLHNFSLVLACRSCIFHGQQTELDKIADDSSAALQKRLRPSEPLRPFAALLLSTTPRALFNLVGLRVGSDIPLPSVHRSLVIRQQHYYPAMQDVGLADDGILGSIPESQLEDSVDLSTYGGEDVRQILDKLDNELIGLSSVKERVREIATLLLTDKQRGKLGLKATHRSLHMRFTGAPGSGKTTVAQRIGEILHLLGYSRSGHVIKATREDLVGQSAAHTAEKTQEMIQKAEGGILLVDEADKLYNVSKRELDYGQDSASILLDLMENSPDDIVVVLTGDKEKMDDFMQDLADLHSQIGYHIDFPEYELEELVEIGKVICQKLDLMLEDEGKALHDYLKQRFQRPSFSNGHSVRTVIDFARMQSAIRLFDQKVNPALGASARSDHQLGVIKAADFPSLDGVSDDEILA